MTLKYYPYILPHTKVSHNMPCTCDKWNWSQWPTQTGHTWLNHIYSISLYSPLSIVRIKAGIITANKKKFFMFKNKYNTRTEVRFNACYITIKVPSTITWRTAKSTVGNFTHRTLEHNVEVGRKHMAENKRLWSKYRQIRTRCASQCYFMRTSHMHYAAIYLPSSSYCCKMGAATTKSSIS
jgi:hypothetical protein